jgi:hypothetical protein
MPVQISSGDRGASNPRIAVNANGDGMAVWQESGRQNTLWSKRYTAGEWGVVTQIFTGVLTDAFDPQIVIDAKGDALAVWRESSQGSPFRIMAGRNVIGLAEWNGPEQLSADNAVSAARPRIAIDANGNALVMWEQFDGSRRNILSSRYGADGSWATASNVSGNTAFPERQAGVTAFAR